MMKMARVGVALGLLAGLVGSAVAGAEGPTTRPTGRRVHFIPPDVAPVEGRSGGGVRCESDPELWAAVLAPKSVAITTQPSPKLTYYISKPTSLEVRVVVQAKDETPPLLEWSSEGRVAGGLHEIDLAQFGKKLRPGAQYTWSVAIRQDETSPAKDVKSTALLELKPPAQEMAATDDAIGRASSLAAAGYFTDAVSTLADAIRAGHDADAAKEELNALVQDVGIDNVHVDQVNPPDQPAKD